MDAGTVQDPRLVRHILQTAAAHNILYQIRQPGGGGTNTAVIQRTRRPIAAATIAVPGRYAHTPTMMINLEDYANVVRLAKLTLQNLTEEIVKRN
jgi:endoglucanase